MKLYDIKDKDLIARLLRASCRLVEENKLDELIILLTTILELTNANREKSHEL